MFRRINPSKNVRIPFLLYPVILVLAYNLAYNLYKFSLLAFGLDLSTTDSSVKSLYILFSTVLSSEMTIRAMVKISSAQKIAWQIATKTLVIQSFFVILNEVLFGRWSANILLESEIPLLFIYMACMIIMFLPHIRRYFIPPMVEMPKIRDWIVYMVIDLTHSERYRYAFKYDKAES